MPKLSRTGAFLLTALTVLVVLSGSGAYLYVRANLPLTHGRLTASGLQAPVEVIRDRWGVPHIWAQNETDLFFAQGYVQAQDRLWQMEASRRAANGTLAEVLGEEALASDKLARTLGFAQAAQREWEAADAETRAMLEAYAQGVNAYLSAPGTHLPMEFRLLGYEPQPWQPQDTLAWARLYAWSLSNGWQAETVRARLVAAVGAERATALDATAADAQADPALLEALDAESAPLLFDGTDQSWPWAGTASIGGTCWAAGGARSATGGAILAASPRMPIQMPAAWYEMQLVGGRYDVAGATLPGIPCVVIGRNRAIAWGLAGSAADTADLYAERIRSDNGLQAEYQGQWEDVQAREEAIRVRGQSEPVRIEVHTTRHGPLVGTDISAPLQPALRWLGAEEPRTFVSALPAINRATDWQGFTAALDLWQAPAQMLAYADAQGNVGDAVAGAVPERVRGTGSLPVPGWSGEYEWQGVSVGDALPRELGQSSEMLAAVDGIATPSGWPQQPWDGAQAMPAADRISELVGSKGGLTVADAEALQCDDLGPTEQPLLSLLLSVTPQNWIQERTMPYLQAWDGRYDRESAGAGVYEAFYWRFVHNTLDDELGAGLVDAYLNAGLDHRVAMQALAAQPNADWFDDVTTPARENRAQVLAQSYAEAVDSWGRRFGDLPYEWNWGRVHNVTFRHLLGERWPLSILLNRGAMRAGGSALSVDEAIPNYQERLTVATASTYRLIADMGPGGQTVAVNAPGQSGSPLSRHYADMVDLWRDGEYHPLLMDREAVLQESEGSLVLTP